MLYILNEKNYISNILASKKKPDDLPMGYFIMLIAKNYYSNKLNVLELSNIVKTKLLEFDLDNYQEYIYHNKIVSTCEILINEGINQGFKERDFIPIYEAELNFINSLSNDKQKKLMFTFIAVARYMDCDGWINKKSSKEISEVFKLANVALTSEKRNELLHELYKNGHIFFGKKVDNLNIKVNLKNYGEIGYKIKEFNNIGYQYIGNFKKGYKQCANSLCGKTFHVTGANNKYCKKCAREKLLEKYKKYNKKR